MSYPATDRTRRQPVGSETLASAASVGVTQIFNEFDADLEALAQKVGNTADADTATHTYKLSGVGSGDKAVSKTGTETLTNKTLTSPTITTPTVTTPSISNPTFSGTATYPNGFIPGNALATSAIKLGYTEITANFLPGTIALTDITGLSVSVTVPAGGRDVLIIAHCHMYNTGSADNMYLYVRESSTTLDTFRYRTAAANSPELVEGMARISAPTAGSHTYKLSMAGGAANPAIEASATEKAYIMVLLI